MIKEIFDSKYNVLYRKQEGGDYMLLNEQFLTLVDVKEIEFAGKDGELISKYKYIFIDEKGETIIGYLDELKWQDKVADTAQFTKDKAFNVKWRGTEYQGEISWRLMG